MKNTIWMLLCGVLAFLCSPSNAQIGMLADISPYWNTEVGSALYPIGQNGDRIYFAKVRGGSQVSILVTDGTRDGTQIIYEWFGKSFQPLKVALLKSGVVLSLRPWVDSTTKSPEIVFLSFATKEPVTLIEEGMGGYFEEDHQFKSNGDFAYFVSTHNDSRREGKVLWRTDGTPEGTMSFVASNTGEELSYPTSLGFGVNATYFMSYVGYTTCHLFALYHAEMQVRRIVSDVALCGGEAYLGRHGTKHFYSFIGNISTFEETTESYKLMAERIGGNPFGEAIAHPHVINSGRLYTYDLNDVSAKIISTNGEDGVNVEFEIVGYPTYLKFVEGQLVLKYESRETRQQEWIRFNPSSKSTTALKSMKPYQTYKFYREIGFVRDGMLFEARNPNSAKKALFLFNPVTDQVKNISDDLEPEQGSEWPKLFGELPSGYVFQFGEKKYGEELWISSGEQSSTRLVKDLTFVPHSAHPLVIHARNGKTLFLANANRERSPFEQHKQPKLWLTDGTVEGTKAFAGSEKWFLGEEWRLEGVYPTNDGVYFALYEELQVWWYYFDFSSEKLVIGSSSAWSYENFKRNAVTLNNAILYVSSSFSGYYLAKFDAPNLTSEVLGDTGRRGIRDLSTTTRGLYFVVEREAGLLFTDGKGQIKTIKLNDGGQESTLVPLRLASVNNQLFMLARIPERTDDLSGVYSVDESSYAVTLIDSFYDVTEFSVINGLACFFARKELSGAMALWCSNGRVGEVQLVAYVEPLPTPGQARFFPDQNDWLFLEKASDDRYAVWRLEGQTPVARQEFHIQWSRLENKQPVLFSCGGKLYFSQYTTQHGFELWVKPKFMEPYLLLDVTKGPQGFLTNNLACNQGKIIFAGYHATFGQELFVERDGVFTDTDEDGFSDLKDAFPLYPLEWLDTDVDGIGNNTDMDDDGDGVPDEEDAYPLDASRWTDSVTPPPPPQPPVLPPAEQPSSGGGGSASIYAIMLVALVLIRRKSWRLTLKHH